MEEKTIVFPVPKGQKDFLLSGFSMLKILLEEKDNPFTETFFKYFNKEKGMVAITNFLEECAETKGQDNWTFKVSDMYILYILLDLSVRIYKAGYFVYFAKKIKDLTDQDIYPPEHLERGQRQTLEMTEDALYYIDYMQKLDYIASFIWQADRFPDPITGISPLLAAYNHLPKLPKNPPQMTFDGYGDDLNFVYHLKKNIMTTFKDLTCLSTIFRVLIDRDNPPALIISAYFPNLKEEISLLLEKLQVKDRRRRKVDLTTGELGLIYACNDLFGRLNASSYHDIMIQLEKNRPVNNPKAPILKEDLTERTSLATTILDRDIKNLNERFGECVAILDYKKIAAVMIGFDE
jgi:hypothetical protein